MGGEKYALGRRQEMSDTWGSFVFYQRQSVRCGQKRRRRESTGKQSLLYSQGLDSVTRCHEGDTHGGSLKRGDTTKQVRNQESEDPGQCLYWESGQSTQEKGVMEFHWCVWLPLGHDQGKVRKGTGGGDQPALSHWHLWSPARDVHGLFVVMWRQQENLKFKHLQHRKVGV